MSLLRLIMIDRLQIGIVTAKCQLNLGSAMTQTFADAISLAGLLLTLIGAAVAAWAVILRPEDAVKIGLARYAGATLEENLQLPTVKNLLKSSQLAKWGFLSVALGTCLQAFPIAARLAG